MSADAIPSRDMSRTIPLSRSEDYASPGIVSNSGLYAVGQIAIMREIAEPRELAFEV